MDLAEEVDRRGLAEEYLALLHDEAVLRRKWQAARVRRKKMETEFSHLAHVSGNVNRVVNQRVFTGQIGDMKRTVFAKDEAAARTQLSALLEKEKEIVEEKSKKRRRTEGAQGSEK